MSDIKIQRIKKGLTQKQLAEQCGVIRQTISSIERGVNKPSIELAKKLGEILEIDWTKFFTD